MLTGGVLVIVGVFLPWVTASGSKGTFSASGKDANEWAFLILGGFAPSAVFRWRSRGSSGSSWEHL